MALQPRGFRTTNRAPASAVLFVAQCPSPMAWHAGLVGLGARCGLRQWRGFKAVWPHGTMWPERRIRQTPRPHTSSPLTVNRSRRCSADTVLRLLLGQRPYGPKASRFSSAEQGTRVSRARLPQLVRLTTRADILSRLQLVSPFHILTAFAGDRCQLGGADSVGGGALVWLAFTGDSTVRQDTVLFTDRVKESFHPGASDSGTALVSWLYAPYAFCKVRSSSITPLHAVSPYGP